MDLDSFELSWIQVDSKTELTDGINPSDVDGEVATPDPDTWGYFILPSGKRLLVGYANLGLSPVAVHFHDWLLVGIDEVFASLDADTLEIKFNYLMPSVFHEFVSLNDPIVVRDEIGFVAVSIDGQERWRFLTGGPIKKFAIEGGVIVGETIDNEAFAFAIPG